MASAFGIADVVRVMRFGDLGLVKGGWLVLGKHPGWAPSEWPMPVFGRRDPTGRAFRVVYSSHDLRGPESEEVITDDECDLLARDALSGSGAVERVLTHLLGYDVESLGRSRITQTERQSQTRLARRRRSPSRFGENVRPSRLRLPSVKPPSASRLVNAVLRIGGLDPDNSPGHFYQDLTIGQRARFAAGTVAITALVAAVPLIVIQLIS